MNVLFVTADQWRGDCLSCLGHPAVRTPNLDRLAADAVLFERHFAQATPCGPSRASLHTGLYALNHRSITNGTPLDARHKTLASLVRAGGYDPVLFGYTDTSADPRTLPADSPWLRTYEGVAPGFRVELRLPEAEEAYLDHLAERGYGRLTYEEVYGGGFRRPAPFRAEDSVTAFMADRFLGWLDRQGSEPWFAHVVVPQAAPAVRGAGALVLGGRAGGRAAAGPRRHAGSRRRPAPVARGASGAAGRGRRTGGRCSTATSLAQLRAVYFGLIAEVDHHLGRILERLARRGELERTLVLFTADHGEMLGDHWMLGKAGFFPQAFHVPLLIRQPKGVTRPPGDGVHRACRSYADRAGKLGVARAAPVRWTLTVGFPYRRIAALLARRRALGARFPRHRGRARTSKRSGWRATPAASPSGTTGAAAMSISPGCRHCASSTMRGWLQDRAGDPACAGEVLAQAQAMLSWRMRAAERRLTGCALTPAGVVGGYDPL